MNGLAYIYALSDPRTKEIRYVGKTFDLKQRLWQHQHDVKRGLNTRKTGWIKSLLKSGYWPTMEELESFPENEVEQWEEAERFWIETLRFYGFRLTNMDTGGGSGRRSSLETRLKIGEHSSRRIHTPETRAKISASCKARMTPEEKERLRVKCSNHRHTEETKRIISQSKLGKPKSPEHAAKLLAGSIRWKIEQGWTMKKPDGKFAKEIVAWRKSMNYQQKEAAAKLDVSFGAYTAWEYAFREPKPMSLPEIRRRMAAVKTQPEIHQK